ncbi:hypothetical protein BC936DRAFT_141234, partial [Jimgerdemannia flammicorona]
MFERLGIMSPFLRSTGAQVFERERLDSPPFTDDVMRQISHKVSIPGHLIDELGYVTSTDLNTWPPLHLIYSNQMTYEPQQPSLDSPDSLPTPNKRHSTTSKSSPTVKTPLTDPMLSQHLKENATLAVAGPASSRKFPSFSSWQHQQSNQRNRAMGRERRELEARHIFESTVRRYYYQLTIGCANPQCTNKLCVSCK